MITKTQIYGVRHKRPSCYSLSNEEKITYILQKKTKKIHVINVCWIMEKNFLKNVSQVDKTHRDAVDMI